MCTPKSSGAVVGRDMKEFVGATQGEDPWFSKPLPKSIGGLVCRSPPEIKRGNMINARGTPQISLTWRGSEPTL